MARKPLSKKTRFEVFKRDDFTCQYCGRKTPTVVLVCDHVVPVIEGGSDDLENLITACEECNQGKGRRPLTSVSQIVDVAERARLMQEREQQLRAYNAIHNERAERIDHDYNVIWNYWFEVWGSQDLRWCDVPWESTIRKYLDLLPVEEIKDAVRITLEHMKNGDSRRYFVGVLKRKQAEYEGRLKLCTYCKKYLILDPGQDTTSEWHHNACREKAESAA